MARKTSTKEQIEFFKSIWEKRGEWSEYESTEVLKHLDYLAEKANTTQRSITNGSSFNAEEVVIKEAIANITAVLGQAKKSVAALVGNEIERLISSAESQLEGWCSREKSLAIVDLIRANKPQECVEIGVYGGRSIVPAAAALRRNGSGHIYGIETWRPDVATEHFTSDGNDEWWKKLDFNVIKANFLRFVAENDLARQIRIIEAPAADASSLFGSIDYLHIDGAHSIYNAAEDVVLYAKKVKKGGIIIMDDADWPTTAPALSILDAIGERVVSLNNAKGEVACIVYKKNI